MCAGPCEQRMCQVPVMALVSWYMAVAQKWKKWDSKRAEQSCASNTNSILEQSAQQSMGSGSSLELHSSYAHIKTHNNQTPLGNVVQGTPCGPRGRPRENSGVIVALFWGNTELTGNKARSFLGGWDLLPRNQRECF